MAKGAGRNGGDNNGNADGINFPEGIIRHIQSYLNAKGAAQTSAISRSWYGAWLSRPIIDLNEDDFKKRDPHGKLTTSPEAFWDFAWKTMRRYEEFNLSVKTFRIRMCTTGSDPLSFLVEFLKKLVKKGVKDITLISCGLEFGLPYQLFQIDTLEGLSLRNTLINGPPPGEVINRSNSNLKSLTLEHIPVEADCFSHIFPFLEDLTIRHCHVVEEGTVKISSASLKSISLDSVHKLEVYFDVPNIRRFKFRSLFCSIWFPTFSTIPSGMEFDLELCFGNCHIIERSWYYKLQGILTKLSESNCKVSITISGSVVSFCSLKDFCGKQGPVVENLILSPSSFRSQYHCYHFFSGLFWCSPPKLITLFWSPSSGQPAEGKENNDLIIFLCEELIDGRIREKIMHGDLELGQVSLECLDASVLEWRPLPWKTLMSAANCPGKKLKVRFRLEWRGK